MLFPLGVITTTLGVSELARGAEDGGAVAAAFVAACLRRHASGDWGVVDAEDAAANGRAVSAGLRVLSSYPVPPEVVAAATTDAAWQLGDPPRLWVITEADRSSTTVLLPGEY